MATKDGGWLIFIRTVIVIGVGFLGWMSVTIEQIRMNQVAIQTQIVQLQMTAQTVSRLSEGLNTNTNVNSSQQAVISSLLYRVNKLEDREDSRSGR